MIVSRGMGKERGRRMRVEKKRKRFWERLRTRLRAKLGRVGKPRRLRIGTSQRAEMLHECRRGLTRV